MASPVLKRAIENTQPLSSARRDDGSLVPLGHNHQIPLATFATWSVNIPRRYAFDDLLDPALWRNVELALQARAGRPKPGDIMRCIADDGSFDAFFVIQEVNRGYRLVYSHAGICREDIASARRAFAKKTHPDTTAVDGQRLAAANAIIDAALASIQEAA